jgi:hypothetical protein
MPTTDRLIPRIKLLFEEKTGWGDSVDWRNQDFLLLSTMIRQQTGNAVSYVTLKRIWGKVKYDNLPSSYTLNALAQFVGYRSWREFSARNEAMDSKNLR